MARRESLGVARTLVAAVLVASLQACKCCEVAEVTIAPRELHVSADYTGPVAFEAHARDEDGNPLKCSDKYWSWDWSGPGVTEIRPEGRKAQVMVQQGSQSPTVVRATVRVFLRKKEGTAQLLVSSAPDGIDDIGAVPPSTDAAAVYSRGRRDGVCDNVGSVHALVDVAPLGDMEPETGCSPEAAVFTIEHGVLRIKTSPPWTDVVDQVGKGPPALSGVQGNLNGIAIQNESQAPDLPAIGTVAVKLWVATDDADPERLKRLKELAESDLILANDIYEKNRVGLTFVPSESSYEPISPMYKAGTGCYEDLPYDDVIDPERLNIYYVDIDMGTKHGIACPTVPVRNDASIDCLDEEQSHKCYINVVYVYALSWVNTTLAHELGHALGLRAPYKGHSGQGTKPCFKGFRPNNVMWSLISKELSALHDHFSIGQAYWMNFERLSWLNRNGAGGAVDCQTHPDLCPLLPIDIVPMEGPEPNCIE